MRILLFIPKDTYDIATNKELVTMLESYLNKRGDAVIAHLYTPGLLDNVTLVHIFGCWNMEASRIMTKATSLDIPTVFSPLGGLEPWIMQGKRLRRKLLTSTYQRKMTRRASAVHLCGRYEHSTFAKLRWNCRTAIIKNPTLTSQLSPEEMGAKTMELYQKVFDSNVNMLISSQAVKALSRLLYASVCSDITGKPQMFSEAKADIAAINDTDWRNICLYATDEKVADFVLHGAEVMGFSKPFITLSPTMRFEHDYGYKDGDIQCEDVLSSNIMLKSKMEDLASDDEQRERKICTMILNIKYELAHGTLPLRHAVNIFESLMQGSFDEDRLRTMLSSTGALAFTRHLEGALSTIVGLSEGFMPVTPRYGKQADNIATKIMKLKNI
ncbi:MAG: hypothetical protein ACI3ZB_07315 [Prevotella sp.]